MKTKIPTHKVQEKIWKILVMNKKIPRHFDSGDLWDMAGEMLNDPDHQHWRYISGTNIKNIICNL